VTATWLFPQFFRQTPYLASGIASLLVLVLCGVGPAIVTQAVTLLAALPLTGIPGGPPLLGHPGDPVRLGIFLSFFVLIDWLAWQRDFTREAAEAREVALRESEARYRHILEHASEGIVVASPAGSVEMANPRFCEMVGYTPEELGRIPITALYAPGELEREPLGWEELARTGILVRERTLRRQDGSTFVAELSVRRTAEGQAHAIIRDVTERRRAEQSVRRERDLLDGILATSAGGIVVVSPEGRVVFLNSRAEAVLGLTRAELADRTDLPAGWRWLSLDGVDLPDDERPSRRVMKGGRPFEDARMMLQRPGGDCRILAVNASPMRDAAGAITAVVLSLSDITDQHLAQRTLREQEERLQHITAAMPGVVYQYVTGPGAAKRFAFVSRQASTLLGVEVDAILDDSEQAWANVPPGYQEAMTQAFARVSASRQPWSFEFPVRAPDGRIRWLHDMATAHTEVDPDRAVWNGIMVDVTERKRLAEELLQSQKMESLGRLAGGVAHDFNNILTVIRGYADVLAGEFGEGDPRLAGVQEIRSASDRATTLTRQLLAVSRRQVLALRAVDLNELVQDMERMLRRVIGEPVAMTTVAGADTGFVQGDPGQFEQVLLNLAVNARDAMPEGGTLTLETSRLVLPAARAEPATRGVPPGDYAVLRVGDTGVGMDEATQGRIFEPFFTTKPAGQGTGLGLSTVYGIVHQSLGFITVESTVGRGTSIRVFLPRLAGAGAVPPAPSPAPAGARRQHRGRVLVVEDDDRVRQLTRRVLEQSGFTALEARDGAEALALMEREGATVDAVVSDVVMPGMGGRDLASRLRATRPALPVLFLSGYAGDEVDDPLREQPHQAYLQKPFSPDALTTALGTLLGEPAAG
jgi:PAS domain S-box-containing protein